MKKILIITLAVFSTAALADNHGGGSVGFLGPVAAKYFAYFLGLGLAVFAGTKAQSGAAAVALEGIARQPSASDKLVTPMIISLALMESLVIFMLISPFIMK